MLLRANIGRNHKRIPQVSRHLFNMLAAANAVHFINNPLPVFSIQPGPN
jgi:hypothetical protein